MLQLYDKNKSKIKGLIKYKDYKIESVLSSADKTLSFSYPQRLGNGIEEEGYIRNKTDEFVIKEVKNSGEWLDIVATMNVEELEGQPFEHFNTIEQTIQQCLTLAVAGTGWTVNVNGSITKKRTIRKTNCSSWDIIQEIKKTYRVELSFDTINKVIQVYERRGSDKGAYFIDTLNLKALEIQSNSYDFYTRLIAIGKDNIKVIVENYQYSSKAKSLIWQDDRYTDTTSLKEDAILKLNEISKPYRSYSANVLDLANINPKYKNILSYELGDIITLIDNEKGIKEKQRIVKITEYPEEPQNNTCEIANSKLSFEEMQKEQKETTDTVNNITSDNGTIKEGAIKSVVENLVVDKADINSLNAATARIGTLETTTVKTAELTVINASIKNLSANKANIDDLTAGNITFGTASGGTLSLQSLLSQFISGANAQIINLTSTNAAFANGVIGSAQISSLDVGKLNAGVLDTTKISIAGANSRLTIKGNVLQIFDNDVNNKLFERVAIGDINHDGSKYGIRIRGSNGTTTLFDENGQTKEGFTDGYNKLDDNSLSSNKIDINSVVTRINNDGTTTIAGTKILVGDRTLELAFSTLNTTVNNQGQTISNQSTQISANTNAIALKLDSQAFSNYKNSNDANLNTINTTLNKATTDISALQGQIVLKVAQTDIDTSISKIDIGVRNLIFNSVGDLLPNGWTSGLMQDIVDNKKTLKIVTATVNELQKASVRFKVEPNTTYTVSCWVKTSENCKGYDVFFLSRKTGSAADFDYINLPITGSAKSTLTYVTGTFTTKSDETEGYIRLDNNGSLDGSDASVWFALLKMVKGNKTARDWMPALEDTQVQIDSVATRIYNAESSIRESKESIDLKVSTSEFASYKSSVSGSFDTLSTRVYNTETSISVLKKDIVLKATETDVDNAVNAIQQGNLIPDGSFENDGVGWDIGGTIVTDGYLGSKSLKFTSKDGKALKRPIIVMPGNKYRVSFWYKTSADNNGTLDNQKLRIGKWSDGTLLAALSTNGVSTNWTQRTMDWIVPSGITSIQLGVMTNLTVGSIQYDDISFVDITAIDGLTTRISDAEQRITPNSIISTVTSSQTYKDNLSGKVDTSTYSSGIQQLAQQISSKVEKNDFGSLITQNADNVIYAFGYVGNGQNLVHNGNATFGTNNWVGDSVAGVSFGTGNIAGKTCFFLSNSTATEHYAYQNAIQVKPNTKYTISFYYYTDSVNTMDCYLIGTTAPTLVNTYIHRVLGNGNNKSPWQKVIYTFTTNLDEKYVFLRFDNNGASGTASYYSVAFTEVKLEEGDKATPFCLANGELNNASVTMDNTGLTINNGNFTLNNSNNDKVAYVDKTGLMSSDRGFAVYNNTGGIHYTNTSIYKMPDADPLYLLCDNGVKVKSSTEGGQANKWENLSCSIIQLGTVDILNGWYRQGYIRPADGNGLHCICLYDHYRDSRIDFKAGQGDFTNLKVSGTKNRIVNTDGFGTRALNAVESAECLFADYGRNKLMNGKCIIPIETIFAQTISAYVGYDVFITKYAEGDIWISERNENYFVVEGIKDIEFCWQLVAKQKGYENTRLEVVES